jgi:UDP-N-acetylmuramyl pentapeptide phosphotransferase/UDP-N-acetylglucosamine-1-phosphate transferase
MTPALLGLGALVAFLVSAALVRLSIPLLARRLPDIPNARSSHAKPVPRGGGIGTGIGLLAGLGIFASASLPPAAYLIVACALFLAAISLLDDARPMRARYRFAAQVAAVGFGLWIYAPALNLPGILPFWLWLAIAGLGWLWFVNLYNFMDGIDGITAAETIALGTGILAVWFQAGHPAYWEFPLSIAVAAGAAMAGFLVWNRHPARIFLGDVGSIPLGFLLGAALLDIAGSGYLEAALILPLYYLADSTITLLRRLFRGDRVWQAHREHFYQRAANENGRGPVAVVRAITFCNLGLVFCAVWSVDGPPGTGLAIAAILVAGTLYHLNRKPGP